MAKFINELPILTSTPNDYWFLLEEEDGSETYKGGLRNILADTKEKLKIAVRTEIVNSILKSEKEIVLKPTITQSNITTILNTIDLNYDGFYNTTNTYRVDCYISGYSTTIPSNTASIIDCSLYVKNNVVIGVTKSNALLAAGTQTNMIGDSTGTPTGTPSGILTIESITPFPSGLMKIDVNKSAPGGVISFKLYSTPHTDLITKIKIIAKKIG